MKRDLNSLILTRQELQIMKVVWEKGSVTVREVCQVISARKPTAYTTILTLMGILEEKGARSHVRAGRAYIYRPLLSSQQAVHNQVHDVIARLFDGSPEKLIENVLDNEIADPEQLSNIRRVLQSRCHEQVA